MNGNPYRSILQRPKHYPLHFDNELDIGLDRSNVPWAWNESSYRTQCNDFGFVYESHTWFEMGNDSPSYQITVHSIDIQAGSDSPMVWFLNVELTVPWSFGWLKGDKRTTWFVSKPVPLTVTASKSRLVTSTSPTGFLCHAFSWPNTSCARLISVWKELRHCYFFENTTNSFPAIKVQLDFSPQAHLLADFITLSSFKSVLLPISLEVHHCHRNFIRFRSQALVILCLTIH